MSQGVVLFKFDIVYFVKSETQDVQNAFTKNHLKKPSLAPLLWLRPLLPRPANQTSKREHVSKKHWMKLNKHCWAEECWAFQSWGSNGWSCNDAGSYLTWQANWIHSANERYCWISVLGWAKPCFVTKAPSADRGCCLCAQTNQRNEGVCHVWLQRPKTATTNISGTLAKSCHSCWNLYILHQLDGLVI